MKDEPLDMRYSGKTSLTAGEVVNSFSRNELADIFYKFGEERRSRKIAERIARAREADPSKQRGSLQA